MSRTARQKSSTGLYHVMLRGADRKRIFADDEDNRRFLEIMQRVQRKSMFQLFAYCLMRNHVHLLLKAGIEPLETTFKRIEVSYVYYYNGKYQLRGPLFQGRYRSEQVEDDAYFMDVLRHICQNPVKAGLCVQPFEHPWLGCSGITESDELLDDLGELTDLEGDALLRFVSEPCDTDHLEDNGRKRLTDSEAAKRLRSACRCRSVQDIITWKVEKRDKALKKALGTGISIRQLSRLTGVSKAVIERIAKL